MNPDSSAAVRRLNHTRAAIAAALRDAPAPGRGRPATPGEPARPRPWVTDAATTLADGLLRPIAQTRPWTLVAVAGLAGAALVLTRPWRARIPAPWRSRLLTRLTTDAAWIVASAWMAPRSPPPGRSGRPVQRDPDEPAGR
jgi:hypothetical protein